MCLVRVKAEPGSDGSVKALLRKQSTVLILPLTGGERSLASLFSSRLADCGSFRLETAGRVFLRDVYWISDLFCVEYWFATFLDCDPVTQSVRVNLQPFATGCMSEL